jgi:antitoxin HicB
VTAQRDGSARRRLAERLASQPYHRVIVPTSEGTFFGEVSELPGCFTEGDTASETYDLLGDAIVVWIADALEEGRAVPDPREEPLHYSGKFVVRVPRTLHGRMSEAAAAERVSLNSLCVSYLSEGLARRDVVRLVDERLGSMMDAVVVAEAHSNVLVAQGQRWLSYEEVGSTVSVGAWPFGGEQPRFRQPQPQILRGGSTWTR